MHNSLLKKCIHIKSTYINILPYMCSVPKNLIGHLNIFDYVHKMLGKKINMNKYVYVFIYISNL